MAPIAADRRFDVAAGEMTSYHAVLARLVVGMGVSMMPLKVLETFPERKRLSFHSLPPAIGKAMTPLIRRKGVRSPKLAALIEVLTSRPALGTQVSGWRDGRAAQPFPVGTTRRRHNR